MKADMTPFAITARLRRASALSDLATERRLHGKIDMSPAGVTARLREVEMLRRTCMKLGRLRRPNTGR